MRFKTRLRVIKIPFLQRIIQALQKVDRRCVLHLTASEDEHMHIIIMPTVLGSVATYTKLQKAHWFEGYRIESQNENAIGLEVDLQNLERALKSAQGGDEVIAKLSKKGLPVLTFEIRTTFGPIVQDVPVSIISPMRLAECAEPERQPVPGVVLPSLVRLHSVVERMKALGNHTVVKTTVGNQSKMVIEVFAEAVNFSAVYDGSNKQLSKGGDMEVERSYEAEIEVKNMAKALGGHQIMSENAHCFVIKHFVLIHIPAEESAISYYIPMTSL